MPETTTDDLVTCPDCGGDKRTFRLTSGRDGAGRAVHSSGYAACDRCKGQGAIPAEYMAQIEAGAAMRAERLSRLVSQGEEARRLGITPQELSRRESGRYGKFGPESEDKNNVAL